MKYIVKTIYHETVFYDRHEAERYYNALNSVGIDAELWQFDINNKVTCLGKKYAGTKVMQYV